MSEPLFDRQAMLERVVRRGEQIQSRRRTRLVALVTACITVAAVVGTLAISSDDPSPRRADLLAEPSPSSVEEADVLGYCSTRRVAISETEPGPDEWSREQVLKKGGTGHVAIVIHGNATIGISDQNAPTDETLYPIQDDDGKVVRRVRDMAVWIVVRDELRSATSRMPQTGTPPPTPYPTSYYTSFASVYDAKTGAGIHGWSCASRTEYADGSVREFRGIDDRESRFTSADGTPGPWTSEAEPTPVAPAETEAPTVACSRAWFEHEAFKAEGSFIRVCPGRARVGDTVVINGRNCGNPGENVYVYFHGDMSGEHMGSDDDAPLGEVRTANDGTFRVTYKIPPEIGPYQTRGAGPVRPGKYGFGTKPPYCEVGFEVIE